MHWFRKIVNFITNSNNSSLWKSELYYLMYLCIFWIMGSKRYCKSIWTLMHHYCVSNILRRIKTVNKMWWYKTTFLKPCFWANYNFYIKRKPKDVYFCYFTFPVFFVFLSLRFSIFFVLSVFFFFFNPFCIPPPNQENH